MATKHTVGILGGSFNPVHIGHMMLASYFTQWGLVDEVWLTLSPRNPLKEPGQLMPDLKRLDMLNISIQGATKIDICDLELTMPRPSYTIRTLDELKDRYPDYQFKLIVGSDNWLNFDKWREPHRILEEYGVMVYIRPGYPVDDNRVAGLEVVEAPLLNISSTFIRRALDRGRDMKYFLPNGVYEYILKNDLYGAASVLKKNN